MIEQISKKANKCERIDKSSYRRIPNNMCRYSPLQKGEYNSSPFECGLGWVTCSQSLRMERETQDLHSGETWQTPPDPSERDEQHQGWIMLMTCTRWYDVIRRQFISALSTWQTHHPSQIMRKQQKTRIERHSIKFLATNFQNFQCLNIVMVAT